MVTALVNQGECFQSKLQVASNLNPKIAIQRENYGKMKMIDCQSVEFIQTV